MTFINYKNRKPEQRIERFIVSMILNDAAYNGRLDPLMISYDKIAESLKDNNKTKEKHMCRITVVRTFNKKKDWFFKRTSPGGRSRKPCSYELNMDKIFESKASYELFLSSYKEYFNEPLKNYFNELSRNYSRKWHEQKYA